jgi:membrane protease YdiL (CAAX protease family)
MGLLILGGWFGVVGGLGREDLGIPTGWQSGVMALNAVVLTYLLWGIAQLLVVGGGLAGLTEVSMNPSWVRPLNPELVGASAATVLAGAVIEEVMYRGFLFVHLTLALRRWGVMGVRAQVGGALVGSQGLFGLNHIPAGLGAGMEGTELGLYVLQVTLVGIAFTVLFLQTQNLLFVVCAHALINNPQLPFVAAVDSSFVVLMVVLGLMLGRSVLARVFSGVLGPRRPSLRRSQPNDPHFFDR